MAYTALYRKWRPSSFDDVKGQDPIMATLKNQVRSGRIGHAYLFCGGRGTGKTTAARILAKAINCLNPKDGEPCGVCESCTSIDAGSSMSVFEIDAASNNGVDNVRNILDEMRYPPTEGRFRVYIIDEVHMFSSAAFNALLKSLEEPPEYVVFILATTEPHKLPATILSRCQQYDFHRIATETIKDRLRYVCQEEGFDIDERAVGYIARKADGGFRDALSLLDQVTAAASGHLDLNAVIELLGAVDTEVFSEFFRYIVNRDSAGLLVMIDKIAMSGKELSQYTDDFIWYLRDLLLRKAAPNLRELIEVSDDDLVRADEDAAMVSMDELMRLIKHYSALQDSMRQTVAKRVVFETGALRSLMPQVQEDMDSVYARLAELERKIESGAIAAAAPSASPGPASEAVPSGISRTQKPVDAGPESAAVQPKPTVRQDKAPVSGEFDPNKLFPKLEGCQRPFFKGARAEIRGEEFTVWFDDEDDKDMAQDMGSVETLTKLVREAACRELNVRFRFAKEAAAAPASDFDDIRQFINFDIQESL